MKEIKLIKTDSQVSKEKREKMVLKRETVIANVELILQTWNKHGIPLQDINHILSRRLKDNSFSDIIVNTFFYFLLQRETVSFKFSLFI